MYDRIHQHDQCKGPLKTDPTTVQRDFLKKTCQKIIAPLHEFLNFQKTLNCCFSQLFFKKIYPRLRNVWSNYKSLLILISIWSTHNIMWTMCLLCVTRYLISVLFNLNNCKMCGLQLLNSLNSIWLRNWGVLCPLILKFPSLKNTGLDQT